MSKIVVVHDLPPEAAESVFPVQSEDVLIFATCPPVMPCVGCFSCWLRTPGRCVIRDRRAPLDEALGRCERLLIVSRCVYGGYASAVKRVIDRSIGVVQPFFYVDAQRDEMHHVPRYSRTLTLHAVFYGARETQRDTAGRLVAANALNLGAQSHRAVFYPAIEDIPALPALLSLEGGESA